MTVPNTGEDNMVTLDAQARSVETTAAATGLSSVHLSGTSVLTATGEVVDRTGRSLGNGELRAEGTDVLVTASALQLTGQLRVQPSLVTASGGLGVTFAVSATVASTHLTFQPPPRPAAPAAPAPGSGSASATTVATTTTVPPPVPVAGPVIVKATGLQISGSGLRLVDAPADLSVSSSEADLSWAGAGSIITSHGPLQATYLGVRAQQLHAAVHRTNADVEVHGTGLALQAYANGVPQLRTPARIDVVSTGATTGFLGRRHAFVWTPRNLGNTYDMAILSIHPGNAAASGVHIGLRPMPPMFGGESHALVGGDTAGLKSGDAIDSLVARHGDDKRSLGYDAAPGVALVLIVQGNFDPITVTVTTY
ncbi:MAG: hypothetical protein QOF30_3294 [Acidimicrobiaceae bacterium]|nr:hypothetical protein [Acidimicrobiaceae bacterium]